MHDHYIATLLELLNEQGISEKQLCDHSGIQLSQLRKASLEVNAQPV